MSKNDCTERPVQGKKCEDDEVGHHQSKGHKESEEGPAEDPEAPERNLKPEEEIGEETDPDALQVILAKVGLQKASKAEEGKKEEVDCGEEGKRYGRHKGDVRGERCLEFIGHHP